MPFTKTFTGPEPTRVNKWLAQEGVCSRREAEALIEKGQVLIDGVAVKDMGHKIAPGQTLSLKDEGAKKLEAQLTIMMHKPVGFVSAQPEGDQIPAVRLMTRANRWGQSNVVPKRGLKLAPLGRLDQDSRGLLLLSEDGVLAKAIIGPQSGMEKEYLVEVVGQITPKKLALLRHGLMLDGRQLLPAIVEQIGPQRLRFILREGRNRQIRRMAEAVELEVVDLLRIRIGPISLGDLPEGRWRPISAEERARLLKG